MLPESRSPLILHGAFQARNVEVAEHASYPDGGELPVVTGADYVRDNPCRLGRASRIWGRRLPVGPQFGPHPTCHSQRQRWHRSQSSWWPSPESPDKPAPAFRR